MKGRTFLELLIVLVSRVANSLKSWVIEEEVYGYVGALFNTAKQTSESFLQPWYLVLTSEKLEWLHKTNLSLPKLLLGRHNEPFPSKKHGVLRLIFPTNEHWRTVTFLLKRSIFQKNSLQGAPDKNPGIGKVTQKIKLSLSRIPPKNGSLIEVQLIEFSKNTCIHAIFQAQQKICSFILHPGDSRKMRDFLQSS